MMKLFQNSLIVAALILAQLSPASGSPPAKKKAPEPSANSIPVSSVDRLNSTPDLMQSLPEAGLPGGGLSFCGPVAVSNTLVWLSHHGYPRLGLKSGKDTPATQGHMALAFSRVMGGTSSGLSSPGNLLAGLFNVVHKAHYEMKSLKYQGWEPCADMFSAGTVPDPSWIKAGLNGPSGVWLMIGFYNYSARRDEYVPRDQHWVTLVGYGQDKQGKKDPNILIIHDPAPRSGPTLSHDFVTLERITHGKFSDRSRREDFNAVGWYKMAGDLKLKEGADCAILDGAVVLALKPPTAGSPVQAVPGKPKKKGKK